MGTNRKMLGSQSLIFENKPKISLFSANDRVKNLVGSPYRIRLLAMKNSAIVDCLIGIDAVNPTENRLSRRAILQRLKHQRNTLVELKFDAGINSAGNDRLHNETRLCVRNISTMSSGKRVNSLKQSQTN